MSESFRQVYNVKYHKPALWESLILRFLPMQMFTSDDAEIHYKTIGSRMYIMKVVHVDHSLPVGYAEYWRN